jgi:hypothetical protein
MKAFQAMKIRIDSGQLMVRKAGLRPLFVKTQEWNKGLYCSLSLSIIITAA